MWLSGHGVRPPLTFGFVFPITALGDCHREADPREAAKWGWPARGSGRSADPCVHWSAAFAHYLLMLGTFPWSHLF
jgi:hypothetical protein